MPTSGTRNPIIGVIGSLQLDVVEARMLSEYGIPCALIVFEGYLDAVSGNGMKYTDYSLGVDLGPLTPAPVPLDLRTADLQSLVVDAKISEAKMDEVEDALRRAVAAVTG